jgi:hypothetical protein
MASYPTTRDEDVSLLATMSESEGPILRAAVTLRLREKDLLLSALDFLEEHEMRVKNGSVYFQLEEKAKEREQATIREEEHKKYLEEIQKRVDIRLPVAQLEVDMGPDKPKGNLTVEEGQDINVAVRVFCQGNNVGLNHFDTLLNALKARVINPRPLLLLLGVVVPTGERHILAIPEGSNATIETGVFCAKYNVTKRQSCESIQGRVNERLDVSYNRRIVLVVPIDAPDGRKLQLVIREGEQHDVYQFVSDFFQLYKLDHGSVDGMTQEVYRRLPAPAITIPISIPNKRQVVARFSVNENITNTCEAFSNVFELDESLKLVILKTAKHRMAPGTYMV